ncbi:methyltransferase [Nonomuraea wenchangensis]|uniref:8-O-methyltransferase n=1 Tax=Nonomuraea wenchangensis TaxID=568860 RepID=A0A1I0AN01_9ACTN|nr:methyltransferase [Nonomuraea wenchangensis]SES95124.1 8-O-methyltransferase [Nonomuraea wenchangensis]
MTTTKDMADAGTRMSPRPLIELGVSFWSAKALLTAVEIGLFTELARGPASERELSERLDLHPRAARDFLDALVALDVLERTDDVYRNTPAAAAYLDEGKDTYLGGWMRQASRHLFRAWGGLTESLRSGKPFIGWDSADYFQRLYEDEEERQRFIAAMDAMTNHIAGELAVGLDWSGYGTVVDVGGARGNLIGHLAQAHPHLRGTVFDLPELDRLFAEHMAKLGTGDRIAFVSGDFFADPLPEADVLIFGHILHDWDDEQRRRLIAHAYPFVRPGGCVVIYDRMIDDERREKAVSLLGCLNLLLVTPGGSEYTVGECRAYARDAGFARTSTMPLFDGLETAVIGWKE